MKFRYKGEYAQYNGYVFKFRHAVIVNDRLTIEALQKNPDYEQVFDAPPKLRPTLSLRARK